MKSLRKVLFGLAAIISIVLILAGGTAYWYHHRPQPDEIHEQRLFEGITYTREVRQQPRPMIIHIVNIDLQAPGIRLLVTPGDAIDGYIYQAQTTSQFLEAFDLQVAINGDFFTPWHDHLPWDYYPHVGDSVDSRGFAASEGIIYTQGYESHYETLFISADNQISFNEPAGEIYNAISGHLMLVENGQPINWSSEPYIETPQPRTAVALDQTENHLLLIVVDGRQPNYSEGVTFTELAQIIVEYGGYKAINFDGGGSSTLVIEDENGSATQLNSPIHSRIPFRERPVANHLGVYAFR